MKITEWTHVPVGKNRSEVQNRSGVQTVDEQTRIFGYQGEEVGLHLIKMNSAMELRAAIVSPRKESKSKSYFSSVYIQVIVYLGIKKSNLQ